MKRHFGMGLVIAAALLVNQTLSAAPAIERRCWGGEGPRPYIDMGSLNPQRRTIRTTGSVQEFVVWENKNAVVFRNEKNEVYVNYLNLSSVQYQGISKYPLEQLASAKENNVVAHGLGWVLDWATGKWTAFGPTNGKLDHLFWHADTLYSLQRITRGGSDAIDFYRYGRGESGKSPYCTWKTADLGFSGRVGVAHGATYPYVYVHATEDLRSGLRLLKLAKFDVTRCQVVSQYDYSNAPISGEVRDVYRYDDINSFGVWLDSPDQNLLWDSGGKFCKFYDIPADSIVPLGTRAPQLAVWAEDDGLSILTLKENSARRAKLANDLPIERLSEKDFWMTSDGKKLYFSPTYFETAQRPILELKF